MSRALLRRLAERRAAGEAGVGPVPPLDGVLAVEPAEQVLAPDGDCAGKSISPRSGSRTRCRRAGAPRRASGSISAPHCRSTTRMTVAASRGAATLGDELTDPFHLRAHVGQRGGGFVEGPVAHAMTDTGGRANRPHHDASPSPMTRVGFLGPHGTFAEEALLTQPDLAAGEAVPFRDVPHVINAVETRRGRPRHRAHRELDRGLDHGHARHPRVRHRAARAARGRPPDLAQPVRAPGHEARATSRPSCRTRTRSARPGCGWPRTCPTPSRSSPTPPPRRRSRWRSRSAPGWRRSAPSQGAKHAGLEILASDIEDHPENLTRFVIVGHGIPAPIGHDKTSVVCFQRQDRPGSLLAILQEFAARAINLTKLESRPTKQSLGDYCFFIDFEGHLDDEIVADCLRNLAAKQTQVKFLGSYPVAGDDGHVRRRAVNKAWRDANKWLDALREQIRDATHRGRRRDRPQATPRRARLPRRDRTQARRARPDRRGARGRRRAARAAASRRRAARPPERGVEGDRQGRARRAPGEDRRRRRAEGGAAARSKPSSPRPTPTLRALALQLPNPADASVPDGGEDDGEVVRTVGDTTAGARARPRRVRRGDRIRRTPSTAPR